MLDFPNIRKINRVFNDSEQGYWALAAVLEEARKGTPVELPPDSHLQRCVAVKENLLVQHGLVAITLTKKRGHRDQQLRGWVSPSHHLRAGQHADGYNHGAVFDGRGSFRVLRALAEEYLVGDFQCFEDENFVVWRRRD